MGVAALGMVLFNRNLSCLKFRPRAVEIANKWVSLA
jgi:hypothetical protein